jgi:hypothetical protein
MPQSKRTNYRIVDVTIATPTLHVAVVQMEGPLPSGKVSAVTAAGRESFAWSSMDEVTRRIEKACNLISRIHEQHPQTNIIIFPEYSIPIELAMPRLSDLANTYNLIIIPGADNIAQQQRRVIFNQSPIILPNTEAIWVTKQCLSQWEEGKIDPPSNSTSPIFRWNVDDRSFFFTINICLDFPTVIRDVTPTNDSPLVHFVPMCSPDMNTFRTYADTVLWENGGRAVFLCNCVGGIASGGSALFAVTPNGARLQPVFSLTNNTEGVAYVDLHCDRLVPPRRSGQEPVVAVGRVFSYDVQTSSAGVEIVPSLRRDEDVTPLERAVLNPGIFGYLGKQLRISFLGVEGYGSFDKEKLSSRNFELYSVLGHHDVMVTHLHHSAYALIFDVEKSFTWKTRTGQRGERRKEIDEHALEHFPYFEVKGYHKVLGVAVPPDAITAFYKNTPSPEDIRRLLDIGTDWSSEAVEFPFRQAAVDKGWVLATTKREPGAIDAVMTLYMDHPDEIEGPLAAFERLVLPDLIRDATVTSIFSGTGHRVNVHYILRISAPRERLFAFIQQIHRKAELAGLLVASTTYIIVAKWSALSIRDALNLPRLPAGREGFLYHRILPRIGPELMATLVSLSEDRQLQFVSILQRILLSWDNLDWSRFPRGKEEVEKQLMAGLVQASPPMLGEVCLLLMGQVEDIVGDIVKEQSSGEEFESLKREAGVPSQKDADQLTLTEKLKILRVLRERGELLQELSRLQGAFSEELTRVRNAISHREFTRITTDELIATIERCSDVLTQWEGTRVV